MNKTKLVEFHPSGSSLFARFLNWLSLQNNWGWELELHSDFSWIPMDEVLAIHVDPSLAGQVLPQVKILPTLIRSLETLDSFFYEDGGWYPRLIGWEALRQVLISEARDLDIRCPAFVVGDGDEVRVVASVLGELGVTDIFLVGDVGLLKVQKNILSRSHIGIQFHMLNSEELTLQAVSAGILVNTVDLTEKKTLLTDLSYFNFMKKGGYILDLNLLPAHNLLLEEAERAELKSLSPILLAATQTRLWLERLKPGHSFSKEELISCWTQFLQESTS